MTNNTNEPQSSGESTADKPGWEREALIKLAGFTYLLILLYLLSPLRLEFHEPAFAGKHTALVDLEGVIAADSPASAENINAGLRAAFEDERTAGVILRINSPGGSPVQAGQINDEIYRLRKDH